MQGSFRGGGGGKAVAESSHRLDIGTAAWLREDLAQPLHIDVDSALVDLIVATPNLRQQLRPVEGSAWMRH